MEVENTALNFSGMDDAALERSLNDDAHIPEDAEPQDDTAPPDAGQIPAASDDEAPAQEGEQAEGQEGEQQKLVDLRALQEERELRKAERDRAAAAEAELARYRQQEAAAQAQQHNAQVQATYEQILMEQGEEAAAQYITAVTQQREGELQAQYAHQQAVNTLSLSEEMVREVYPDYDERFNRMLEVLGPDATRVLVTRSLQEAPRSPAKWLYEQAKTHFPTPADQQAAIAAEVQRQVAALQSKGKPPAVRGHQSIGHISSGTQNPGAAKPIRKMSDAELERSLYD